MTHKTTYALLMVTATVSAIESRLHLIKDLVSVDAYGWIGFSVSVIIASIKLWKDIQEHKQTVAQQQSVK